MIRLAEPEDYEHVENIVMEFIGKAYPNDPPDLGKVQEIISGVVAMGREKGIILLSDHGILIGYVNSLVFSREPIAMELAWYATDGQGMKLLKAFEYWARLVNCKKISLSTMSLRLDRMLTKRGYKLTEMSYLKDL